MLPSAICLLLAGSPRAPSPACSAAFERYYREQGLVASEEELDLLFATLTKPLPLDVRASPRAALAERALERLRSLAGAPGAPLSWSDSWQWANKADASPSASSRFNTFLRAQQLRGALQRQESASLLPAVLLAPEAHHAVLDLCAAPGSKSCQLLEMMERAAASGSAGAPTGVLVCNDASLGRTISLTHRMSSVNVASAAAVVTSLDGRWMPSLRDLRFDRVLCDVPCSGDGTLRKNPLIWKQWTASGAHQLHPTQVGRRLGIGLVLGLETLTRSLTSPLPHAAADRLQGRPPPPRWRPARLLDVLAQPDREPVNPNPNPTPNPTPTPNPNPNLPLTLTLTLT